MAGAFGRWNGGDIVKARGVVKGNTITFDEYIDLPEGQQVEVEIHPVAAESEAAVGESAVGRAYPMPPELEARIATEPQFENLRRVDKIREELARRWGGPRNLSTQFIREDRER